MDERLTALFRQCDPRESLQPDDPRYVNVDAARGEDVVHKYVSSISMAGPKPEIKFFAGHLGIGKSSELFRLRKLLEGQAFTVVYIDVSESLDVNDLDFPDLLAVIADQTLSQLRGFDIPGFGVVPQYLARVAGEFAGLLTSKVTFKGLAASTGFGSAAIELKNNPAKRQAIRDAIESVGTQLLDAINDMLSVAIAAIRRENRNGLVLIVDGLDKVQRRAVDEDGGTTHDRLFIDRSTQLASLNAHCVYTVPISLLYSPRQALLQEAFGEFDPPLPMIALRGPDKGPITHQTAGMRAMVEMINLRCASARLSQTEAFEPAAVDLLCRASGGHPRHLMAFIQGACNETDRLPITEANARRSVRRYANSLFRQLPNVPEYLKLLKAFDGPQRDYPRDDVHWQMLYLLHLFEYMNGDPYYEVNPAFRELASYNDA